MDGVWQDILAAVVALVAVAWLIRRRTRRRAPGCDSCASGEASPGGVSEEKIVPVSSLRSRR
jgi:hypothetical protein